MKLLDKIFGNIFKPMMNRVEALFYELNSNAFASTRTARTFIVPENETITYIDTARPIQTEPIKKQDDKRIEKKPVEILDELFENELNIDCSDLINKIRILEKVIKKAKIRDNL